MAKKETDAEVAARQRAAVERDKEIQARRVKEADKKAAEAELKSRPNTEGKG